MPKKGRLGQFANLRGGEGGEGGWQEREGGVFEEGGGVDTPMHTMAYQHQEPHSEVTRNFLKHNRKKL